MAKLWNIRLRHEWLTHGLKGKRLKRRKRARIGLEEALQRKAPKSESAAQSEG